MSTVMDPFPCLSDMFGTSNTTKKVATALDPFPCLSGMFGTYNTTKKVATAGTCDTPSNNEEDGLVHVSKSDKLNGMGRESEKQYVDLMFKGQMKVKAKTIKKNNFSLHY
ncbi:hypothetical protein Tco_0520217 [Tanacetum coccineum]